MPFEQTVAAVHQALIDLFDEVDGWFDLTRSSRIVWRWSDPCRLVRLVKQFSGWNGTESARVPFPCPLL
jgi:hypothetical protein